MSSLHIPDSYETFLSVKSTEKAIKEIKEFFQLNLATELCLSRVTAPLFVKSGLGINDDLNGVERSVSFPVGDMPGCQVEVVQSLAKWKRLQLADLRFETGFGLYTDMNAIRPDESLDNIHSLYVDQWDWEKVITAEQRNLEFLQTVVTSIYGAIRRTEFFIFDSYPQLKPILPATITFVHAEDLCRRYPTFSPKEREDAVVREHGAVFVIGIGAPLSDGNLHDGRAPDYDDWITETAPGYFGLNGDILVWHPVLERAFELSSMGIRVSPESLQRQLVLRGCEQRKDLYFHRRLLQGELPLSLGGGIGQSRLCMFLLRKAHIGEIQVGVWPDDMVQKCRENGIVLL